MTEITQGAITTPSILDATVDVVPLVTGITPAPGSITPAQVVQFDVTSTAPGGISAVVITARYVSGPGEEIFSGVTFTSPFSGSTRAVITDGFQFQLSRSGSGWLENMDLEITASGADGGVLAPNPTLITYTIPAGVGANAARTAVKVSAGGL